MWNVYSQISISIKESLLNIPDNILIHTTINTYTQKPNKIQSSFWKFSKIINYNSVKSKMNLEISKLVSFPSEYLIMALHMLKVSALVWVPFTPVMLSISLYYDALLCSNVSLDLLGSILCYQSLLFIPTKVNWVKVNGTEQRTDFLSCGINM